MSNGEKMRVIRLWCHRFGIVKFYTSEFYTSELLYGEIWLYNSTIHPLRTKYYRDESIVIAEAYNMLRTRAWNMVEQCGA